MKKKYTHIAIILVFSINIMGAGLASASADCVMSCCDTSGTWAKGISSLAAPDCCDSLDKSCGPEAAGRPGFEAIIQCPVHSHSAHLTVFAVAASPASAAGTALPLLPSSSTHHSTGSTQPLFVLNLSWLC